MRASTGWQPRSCKTTCRLQAREVRRFCYLSSCTKLKGYWESVEWMMKFRMHAHTALHMRDRSRTP